MASGKQLAEANYQAFQLWCANKTEADFRAMASRGVLSRTEIAKECQFSKSALEQNPRIKKSLRELEDALRTRGVLPPAAVRDPEVPLRREPGRLSAALESERLRRLEQENASLRAEVSELRRILEQHTVLREALALTGRLPR